MFRLSYTRFLFLTRSLVQSAWSSTWTVRPKMDGLESKWTVHFHTWLKIVHFRLNPLMWKNQKVFLPLKILVGFKSCIAFLQFSFAFTNNCCCRINQCVHFYRFMNHKLWSRFEHFRLSSYEFEPTVHTVRFSKRFPKKVILSPRTSPAAPPKSAWSMDPRKRSAKDQLGCGSDRTWTKH